LPRFRKENPSNFDIQELEDIYLPYKRKTTKADVAREHEPLAKIIMATK
jgi:uncharacterized protein